MTPASAPRLRPHPVERFAPREDVFDLGEAADELLWEPVAAQNGHRQKALFRHGPATLALYCFEAGGRLDDHVVDGPEIIHVLAGDLVVTTDQAAHELRGGMLLRLAPGVRHDIHARQASRMLLTVCVEGPGSHS